MDIDILQIFRYKSFDLFYFSGLCLELLNQNVLRRSMAFTFDNIIP